MRSLLVAVLYAAYQCAQAKPLGPMPPQWNVNHGRPEQERLDQWQSYYKTWPREWPGESEGFKRYAVDREHHIMKIKEGTQDRWEFWLDFAQIRLHPKFTDTGYKVVKIPEKLFDSLKSNFHKQYPGNSYSEGEVPYFITGAREMVSMSNELRREVEEGVKGIHEDWSGHKLQMTSLYGIRTYENGSTLAMHVDRAETHVISAILHIARDYGGATDSWPIEIVDLDGIHRKVELQPGEMLLYESSKCTHGRPTKFHGKYYASAFIHFKPVNGWGYNNWHRVAAVPPHFGWTYEAWKEHMYPKLQASLGSGPDPRKAAKDEM